MTVDRRVGIRATLVMLAVLAPVFATLAITLPRSFFEDWGWLAGPGAWMACALVAGRVCRLPLGQVALGAALSGLPSGLLVLVGLHDVGPLISLPLFGLWCGRLSAAGELREGTAPT